MKKGFGYYHRLFTHYSVSYGIQKIKEAKMSEQGCISLMLIHSQINVTQSPAINKTLQPTSATQKSFQKLNTQYKKVSLNSRNIVNSQNNLKILPPSSTLLETAGTNNSLYTPSFNNNLKQPSQGFNLNQNLNPSFKTSNTQGRNNTTFNNEVDDQKTTTMPITNSHRQVNNSLITIGTDNTELNIKEQFPVPAMNTDRNDRYPVDYMIKAPKPQQQTPQLPLIRPLSATLDRNPQKRITFGLIKEDLPLKDVSSMVYLKIKGAAPNSVIHLPDKHIVLPGLTFCHPLTLVGNAGTTLEIVNGNMLVDFRNYKASLSADELKAKPFMRVLIQETTVVFKVNPLRMRDRYDEYQTRFRQLKSDKRELASRKQDWTEHQQKAPLLGEDLSIDASYEDNNQMPYSMRGLKYVSVNKGGLLQMPMMVVESESVLEVRDCLIRSSRSSEGGNAGTMAADHTKLEERSEWTLKEKSISFIKDKSDNDSLDGRRESFGGSDLEDIAVWINGGSMSDACPKGIYQDFNGIGMFASCIFHNFYQVARAGVNSTLSLQKCVIKETKSHGVHIVNPNAAMIDRCSFQFVRKCGICIEFLKQTNRSQVLRNVIIQGNDIRQTGKDGILIQSFHHFSAHNLRIIVKDNIVQRCSGEGLAIKNLAIGDLEISGNEIIKNQSNGLYLSQVHQKSNKFKFRMFNNKCNEQASGYGCYINDTGILIEDCEFKNNENGGLHVLCSPLKTEKPLSDDIRSFLERYPMVFQAIRCEFVNNTRSGIVIDDFWKGPILLQDCKFTFNKHSGVILTSSDYPSNIEFFKTGKDFNSLNQSGIRKLSTQQSRIIPSNLFDDTNQSKQQPSSNYQNPFKNRLIGCVYLQDCTISDNKTHGVSIVNVLTDFNNCYLSRNLAHAINLQEEQHHVLLNFRLSNTKEQLQGTVGGTWGVMTLKFKGSGCASCGPLCGVQIGQSSVVFQKKIIVDNHKPMSNGQNIGRINNRQTPGITIHDNGNNHRRKSVVMVPK